MADKPKFVPITDPAMAEELADRADLSKPYTVKPNGHLWVLADELKEWRALRANSDNV